MKKHIILIAGAAFMASTSAALADPWHHGDHDGGHYGHGARTAISINIGDNGWHRPYYHRYPHYYHPHYYVEPLIVTNVVTPPPVIIEQPPMQLSDNGQYCREYQTKTNIGGRWQMGYGTACLQPDGSWQFVN